MCVCVFIKLYITAQSGPVVLVILCTRIDPSKGGSVILTMKTSYQTRLMCVYFIKLHIITAQSGPIVLVILCLTCYSNYLCLCVSMLLVFIILHITTQSAPALPSKLLYATHIISVHVYSNVHKYAIRPCYPSYCCHVGPPSGGQLYLLRKYMNTRGLGNVCEYFFL